MNNPIPLNDLKRHWNAISADVEKAVAEVLSSGWYVMGPKLKQFEVDFAAYCGVKHVVGTANGTDALELALRAAKCGDGDEVVTVANAGGYSSTAILQVGAQPVYVEVDEKTFLITAENFKKVITQKTKAIIITHLYGLMADMDVICDVAKAHNVIVIEDCAQAHGAVLNGKKAGSIGDISCFSFYPTKNLGALGDAGAVATSSDKLAEKLRALRQYGWEDVKYKIPTEAGRNSRMDEIQAAALSVSLKHLDGWNEKRRAIIERYRNGLAGLDIEFQQVKNAESFVAHLCVARVKERDKLRAFLQDQNIVTDVHYPIADYLQPGFAKVISGSFKLSITEKLANDILTLPCFPEMSDEEIERVIHNIKKYFSR